MSRSLLCLFLVSCVARNSPEGDSSGLTPTPAVLRASTRLGASARLGPVAITHSTGAAIPFDITTEESWLSVTPASGVTPAAVEVYADAVAVGEQVGTLTINGRATILVELSVVSAGWSSLGGPNGGRVSGLAVDPSDPDRVLASIGDDSGDGEVWLSRDGGASFDELVLVRWQSYVTDVAIAADGWAYATVPTLGVVRSDDAGETWQAAAVLGNAAWEVTVATDRVFALTDTELFVSADHGDNWNTVAITDPTFVGPDPLDPANVLVGDSAGFLHRGDGLSFASYDTGMGCGVELATAVPGRLLAWTGCGELYASADGGTTWQRAAVMFMEMYGVVARGNEVWAQTPDAPRYSDDGGLTFRELVFPGRLPERGFSSAIGVHPDGALFGHLTGGVFRHTGRDDLEQVELRGHCISGLDVHGGAVYGVTEAADVFRWRPGIGFEGLAGENLVTEFRFDAITVSDSDIGILTPGRVYNRSGDLGVNWVQGVAGAGMGPGRSVSRVPGDGQVIWLATGDGLYRSLDGGTSFSREYNGDTWGVVAISADQVLFADGFTHLRRFTRSTGGVDPTDVGNAWVTGGWRVAGGDIWISVYEGETWRSRDDGVTFEMVGPYLGDGPGTIVADPADPARIVIGTEDALLVSDDDGLTWRNVPGPFEVRSLAVDPASGVLYVGTCDGGLFAWSE